MASNPARSSQSGYPRSQMRTNPDAWGVSHDARRPQGRSPRAKEIAMKRSQTEQQPSRFGSALRQVVVTLAVLAGLVAAPAEAEPAQRPAADGEVVRDWNTVAFDTIRQTNGGDAVAARLYALVNVAMYDAVNGLAGHPREAAIVPPKQGSDGDPTAAAAAAAHDVLAALYPARAAAYDAHLAGDLAAVTSKSAARKGRAWGSRVAAAVLRARADDGSSGSEIQPAGSGPGRYRAAWDAHFRHLQPFAIADPQRYVDVPTPPLDSAEYAAAFNDVKTVGSDAPDPQASATYDFWKLSSGSNQPPGAWLQVAQTVSAERGLSLADTARLFALESMALADVVAPTNETKHASSYWRPETAIREADPTTNPNTVPEPAWRGRAALSGTPEHYSGHSSFSAAGAEILASFFGTDAITFTLRTDTGGGAVRTYPSFSAAAAEAGRSRVLGGQHFEFSNQAGLRAGKQVADEVFATSLRRIHP